MPEKIIEETKNRMETALGFFKKELSVLRAGRANPAMLENVPVDVYGSHMRIRELGNITSPEPMQLIIMPFDISNAQHIAKAIDKENLGVRADIEGKMIRVRFPELNQERRKELIAQCHKKQEDAKVSLRAVRRDQNEVLKKHKTDKTLSEDDLKRLEKQIQDILDNYCKKVDEMTKEKEKEISTI